MLLAHELAAERNPLKREQHLKSAAYYRKLLGLREFNMGQSKPGRAVRDADAARIKQFKGR
jgi:hypothetical protein